MNAAVDSSPLLGSFSETIGVQLKNRSCKLTVSGNVSADERERGSRLIVTLESAQTREMWQSSFTPAALEDITKKTGNFKRFSVFVEMLLSSLRKVGRLQIPAVEPLPTAANSMIFSTGAQSSQIVQLDFLTSDDLESLKSTQRQQTEQPPHPSDRDRPWKKVYMILTYAVAFDRYAMRLFPIKVEIKLLRENDKLKYKLKHVKPVSDTKYGYS
ncbi:hypothetical protein HDU86_003081 [Geranomyces michiganensis]|nr:hypothetical protein HDU86_003081 [Geranomyces michiganensis]